MGLGETALLEDARAVLCSLPAFQDWVGAVAVPADPGAVPPFAGVTRAAAAEAFVWLYGADMDELPARYCGLYPGAFAIDQDGLGADTYAGLSQEVVFHFEEQLTGNPATSVALAGIAAAVTGIVLELVAQQEWPIARVEPVRDDPSRTEPGAAVDGVTRRIVVTTMQV